MKTYPDEPINAIVKLKQGGQQSTESDFDFVHEVKLGLTKREHFAISAMQGLLANGMGADQGIQPPYHYPVCQLCSMAVEYADALIKALNQEKP